MLYLLSKDDNYINSRRLLHD